MNDLSTEARSYPRSLRYADWPAQLRDAWVAALQPAGFLEVAAPASQWSATRRRQVVLDAGRFLNWHRMQGVAINSPAALVDAATPAALAAFATAERKRLRHSSLATAMGNVIGLVRSLCPGWDPSAAYRIVDRIKAHARREPRMPRLIADPVVLYEAGLAKMDRSLDEALVVADIEGWQSGLMVALCAAAPVRIRNFAAIVLGEHLRPDPENAAWWLRLASEETKTQRSDDWPVPEGLLPYLDHHVSQVRPNLLARGRRNTDHGALWIGAFGQPLEVQGVRARIKTVTAEMLAHPITPHRFRHSAATGFALRYPDRPRDTAALLGHAGAQTTEKHYLMASRQLALRKLREVLEARLARVEGEVEGHQALCTRVQ